MNSRRYIFRSLFYYWKQHLGILIATIIATAVLTGALIVGDSVKYSLLHLVELRLGNAQYVLATNDRFVSKELGKKIGVELNSTTSSVLFLESIAINTNLGKRKNKVQLLGIDELFWKMSDVPLPILKNNEVVISQNLANFLEIGKDDHILLRIRNISSIPVNAPFSDNTEPTITLRVKVVGIAGYKELGRFSLRNDQKPPYNIFINGDYISQKLGMENKINIILVEANPEINLRRINNVLNSSFILEDAGLKLIANDNYTDLVSDRIFIDENIAAKLSKTGIPNSRVLTYFTNSINLKSKGTPYSFVSAVEEGIIAPTPKNDQIVLNSWLSDDLGAEIGDTISLNYYTIGPLQELTEESDSFIVSGISDLGNNHKFRSLMPDFPGLKDASSCGDWEAGIPIDLDKIRDKDEEYWDEFKGTPKAIIWLEKGRQIWKNTFGSLTLIRYETDKTKLTETINELITPDDLGYEFVDMRETGSQAAKNGIDFGELFLSLSFFIILSAVILLVLIHQLNLYSRVSEIGTLKSLGFRKSIIIGLKLRETFWIVLLGSILGGFLGIYYNKLVLYGLNTIWNEAVHADLIILYVNSTTLLTGIISGIIISVASILIPTIRIVNKSATESIKKIFQKSNKSKLWLWFLTIITLIVSLALLFSGISGSSNMESSQLLISAFLILISLIGLTSIGINSIEARELAKLTILNFALKNIVRNKSRSLASISLLALGVFTIFVTGANRLTFNESEENHKSGTGGFDFWMETTVPLAQNLNTERGRNEFGLEDTVFRGANFIQLSKAVGDDASCLNLNQIQKPSIVGVNPNLFDSLDVFDFAATLNKVSNPWLELNHYTSDSIIPAIADQTVIQWGLIKALGDTLNYINEFGKPIKLVLVGGLKPSVFQGNILISNSLFQRNFPSSSGSGLVLLDVPSAKKDKSKDLLQKRLVDFGVEISSTSERLLGFYSVTNTYLTIFLFLGGLGILMGTIGFGIIIIRNLIDRKREIAVYSALGIGRNTISIILIIENIMIFATGLIIGLICSVIGILPSIVSESYTIPGNFILILMIAISANVLFWIILPVYWMVSRRKSADLRVE